jgi:ubiquinone biosynthesis protein
MPSNFRNLWLDAGRLLFLFYVLVKFGGRPLLQQIMGHPVPAPFTAVRVRLAIERLGIVYIKFGQFLAIRHDIIPPVLVQELRKLLDQVPPMPSEQAMAIVEKELGAPLNQFFSSFTRQPIAAASIAQVHEATTLENEKVVVKIRREGIRRIFDSDIRNLRRLAVAFDTIKILGTLRATEAIDQFASFTSRELDFLNEAATAEKMRATASLGAAIPKIYSTLSTSVILTMEYMEGLTLLSVIDLYRQGGKEKVQEQLPLFDPQMILHNLSFASLQQLFVTGVFHGDPHPANIIIRPDNTVAFVDFGISGEFGVEYRMLFALYTWCLGSGQVGESFFYLSQIYKPTKDTRTSLYKKDTIATLSRWYEASRDTSAPIPERSIGRCFDNMVMVVQRHRCQTRLEYLLYWRTIITLDSTALQLACGFDLTAEVRDFFEAYGFNTAASQEGVALLNRKAIVHILLMLQPILKKRARLPDIRSSLAESRKDRLDRSGLVRLLCASAIGMGLAIGLGKMEAGAVVYIGIAVGLLCLALNKRVLSWLGSYC